MAIRKIFDPQATGRCMQVVPWGSGSGTNIEAMIRGAVNYYVVAILYDQSDSRIPRIASDAGIPAIFVDSDPLRRDKRNGQLRDDYFRRLFEAINDTASREGFVPDLYPLGGFMLRIPESAFQYSDDRIINVHPADLSIRGDDGKRNYTGDKAVQKAVRAREPATKSTIHVVTPQVDGGEILVQSRAMTIDYGGAALDTDAEVAAFADAVQKRQKEQCDWPAYVAALRMIAGGRLALSEEKGPKTGLRTVHLDGRPLPYKGYQLQGGD